MHTVYNKHTKLYVLWVNLNGGKADYAVGTSTVPEGPFTFHNYANAAVAGAGDFDILIDDDADASAYLIYTGTRTGHTMSLEKLSGDYLTSLATPGAIAASVPALAGPIKSNISSGIIGMGFVEAPAIFKRKGVYYALFGNCCCFCGQGSGIGVRAFYI